MFPSALKVVCAAATSALVFVVLTELAPARAGQTKVAKLPPIVGALEMSSAPVKTPPAARVDVEARDGEGRTPLHLATERRDFELVTRLLEMGANAESADARGITPLMLAAASGDLELMRTFLGHGAKPDAEDSEGRTAVHHAIAARQAEAVELLLEPIAQLDPSRPEKPDLLASACQTEDARIISAVLNRTPANLEWSSATRAALHLALTNGDGDLARLLLRKHPGFPTVEGRNVPLLAQTIVDENIELCQALLSAGADPNVILPTPSDKDFVASLPGNLRPYVRGDDGITPLMIAAGMGKTDFVRALLEVGADRKKMTRRYKMLALYFAVRTETYKAVQMLLGTGPTPENLRIEISLATQRASVIKDGTSIFQTQCSTGREGFATPAGKFVITDKKRSHMSSIYKVEMPYFMRLNCLDFGMHEGVVPDHPASHGCIRLPSAAARKLFSEIPVGTVVMIN